MTAGEAEAKSEAVLPLAGIRVVEAATLIAAPFAASLLGEFGAEVLKVEGPTGDPMRAWPPFLDGTSLAWRSIARNKRATPLDFHRQEDRARLRELLGQADVFITNFRESALDRWHLDYDDVKAENPGLIMLHVTGFGRTGPYRDRPGFGRVAEAFGGLTYITGDPDSWPVFPGYPIGDAICGIYGAFSVMLALQARRIAKRGGLLDLGLYEPILRLLEDLIPGFVNAGVVKTRQGSNQSHSIPNGLFPTADGNCVVIPASTANVWHRLSELIGDVRLRQFVSRESRGEHREFIDEVISTFTSKYGTDELVALMNSHGVACGRINSAEDIANDPHVRARGNIMRGKAQDGETEIAIVAPIPSSDLVASQVKWVGPSGNDDVIHGSE